MNKNKVKQSRKTLFHNLKIAEKKLESASVIIDREYNVDAIPVLYKSLDIILRTLADLKNHSSTDYQKNVQTVKQEYGKEIFLDKETLKFIESLAEMNNNYQREPELDYSEAALIEAFRKTEKFLEKIRKFLKDQFTTEEEKKAKRRVINLFIGGAATVGAVVFVFFIIRFAQSLLGPQHGLLAQYYNNLNLKGVPVVEKIDKKIEFIWGNTNRHSRIPWHFSARWEGQIKIDNSDDYIFYIESDEGVRLYLDSKVLINTWSMKNKHPESSAEIHLDKGLHKIKLDYFFNQRHASLKLLWSSHSFPRKLVKSKVLFPPEELKPSM